MLRCGSKSKFVAGKMKHKGKPKPRKIWVSPAPKGEKIDDGHSNRNKETERTTNIIAKNRSGLEGQTFLT